MTKILATSDLHGNLPAVDPCDLLLIGGDICPDFRPVEEQGRWLDHSFRPWLMRLHDRGVKHIVGIAGNHDFIFQQYNIEGLNLPWTYLRDSETTVEGLRIYGTPWVPNLRSWAFYASKEELHGYYLAVPKGTDIVLAHGPPRGYGDRCYPNYINPTGDLAGNKSAVDMMDRVKPKALVVGHIHEGFGCYQHNQTYIYNVAYVDEVYNPRGKIIEIELGEDVINDARQEQEESHDLLSEIHTAPADT